MDAEDPQIVKATRIDLNGKARTADAIQQIINACLRQVTGNGPLIRTMNPDALHQTRVGIRRTRSALVLFKKQIDKASRQRMNEELRSMGNRLGENRDLDVFLTHTLPRAERQLGGDLQELKQAVERRHRDAYARAGEEVWQVNDTTLILRDDGDEPIEDVAPELLARVARRVKKCLRHLDTPEQRHGLRKRMKKLRYGVEFFESLYEPKAVKQYLQRCKDLQEVLGDMNDASTTVRLSRDMAGLPGADRVYQWAEEQQGKTVEQLRTMIGEFRGAKPFWH